MTAATGRVFGPKPFGDPLPWAMPYPLKANVAPFRFWLMGLNSSGLAVAQAAGVTNLVSAGYADRDEAASIADSGATLLAQQKFVSGFPSSTAGGDAFATTDTPAACWAADNQTIGKKSNSGGSNRSLLGLFLGIDPDNNTPIIYPGPIGWLLGRLAHMADNSVRASFDLTDAAAGTATAERPMSNRSLHGKVTSIEFDGLAVVADAGDFVTITVSKRDGAGGNATTLGTYSSATGSNGAVTAFVPATFTLSATASDLDILETDILTITVTKTGAGKQLTGTVRVNQKVG